MSWAGSKLHSTSPCWQSLTQRKLTEASCLVLKKARGKEMSGDKGMGRNTHNLKKEFPTIFTYTISTSIQKKMF